MEPAVLAMLTKILGLDGQEVLGAEIHETTRRIDLILAEPSAPYVCPECGREHASVHDRRSREVRDLPWAEYQVHVQVTQVRIRCCKGRTPIEIPPASFVKKRAARPSGSGI